MSQKYYHFAGNSIHTYTPEMSQIYYTKEEKRPYVTNLRVQESKLFKQVKADKDEPTFTDKGYLTASKSKSKANAKITTLLHVMMKKMFFGLILLELLSCI